MKKIDAKFVADEGISPACESAVNSFLQTASNITAIKPVVTATIDGRVIIGWNAGIERLEVDVDNHGMFLIHSSVGSNGMTSIHPGGFVIDLRDLNNQVV